MRCVHCFPAPPQSRRNPGAYPGLAAGAPTTLSHINEAEATVGCPLAKEDQHMTMTLEGRVQTHNERPSPVCSSGGKNYDQISRGIADAIEHCVLRLNPRPGERILDLSTGTGWTSRLLARRGAMGGGVDIADELLDVAREKARREKLPIAYELGDAEDLPFDDGAFDAVVSTFGVMFAGNPGAAASELARVCRSDGRIAL